MATSHFSAEEDLAQELNLSCVEQDPTVSFAAEVGCCIVAETGYCRKNRKSFLGL